MKFFVDTAEIKEIRELSEMNLVDGVTTTEQYFSQLWLVSDLDNSESNHTVDDYMLCILEYKFVDPTANALTIPDDIATLEEV